MTHLLPTPRAQNASDRNQTVWQRPDGEPLNLENALALLPTPTASDSNQMRTTHVRGNPTLQGAVGGVRPEELARTGPGNTGRKPKKAAPGQMSLFGGDPTSPPSAAGN